MYIGRAGHRGIGWADREGVGLADYSSRLSWLGCSKEGVGLTDWSAPTWENSKFYASTVLEHEIYAHRCHSQMLIALTRWPFDFHALEYAEFKIRQKNQWYQGKHQNKLLVTLLSTEIYQQLVVPPAKNHHRLQHVIPHGLQYDQAE
jgi:hypothetical protein